MKILHINSYYNGRFFYKNLFDKQVENGLEINVFVPVPTPFKKTDVDVGSYTIISENHKKYDRLFFHLKHTKILKDIQKKYILNEHTLIHAHSLFSNGYIAMMLKKKYGTPYVVAVRNSDVNVFFKRMLHLRKMGVRILKEATKIIFLSEPYKDMVLNNYVPKRFKMDFHQKSIILPNGIDDFWFESKSRERVELVSNYLKILYVGEINKNKNLTTTIEAIEVLQKKGYKVMYTVVGEISDENVFDQIKQHQCVNYIPPLPKEELKKIYNTNDLFVMPSIHETLGLVYIEAMSQGLPLIYSRGQGFDGKFEDKEVGYAVDCFDFLEIAKRIEDIIKDYQKISARCIRAAVDFNWNSISQTLETIYLDCIENGKENHE